jgi:N-methylhydantoinase A/oxoprolinase/acetone carboxylase beta subunit
MTRMNGATGTGWARRSSWSTSAPAARPAAVPALQAGAGAAGGDAPRYVRLAGYANEVPVWRREGLQAGQRINGPALITETVATTYLPAGWQSRVDDTGNLRLER